MATAAALDNDTDGERKGSLAEKAERQGPAGLPSPTEGNRRRLSLRRRAVALQYDPEEAAAPKVVAEGSGRLAERILELARQHDVPIREDPLLVEALARLEVGETIPPELYLVVAELFAWLYHLEASSRTPPPRPGR